MPQHDIYPSADGRGYLLDVQTDHLEGLETRVVVPILPIDGAPRAARVLNPVIEIDGLTYVMATQYVSAVRGKELRSPIANLAARSDEITRALDMLFSGF